MPRPLYAFAAFLCLVGPMSPLAVAGGHEVRLKTTATGKAGQVITAFDVRQPGEYVVTFPNQPDNLKPQAVVTVVWKDKADGPVQRFDNKGGTLPMCSGRIERVTIEFKEPGSLDVEVNESK